MVVECINDVMDKGIKLFWGDDEEKKVSCSSVKKCLKRQKENKHFEERSYVLNKRFCFSSKY